MSALHSTQPITSQPSTVCQPTLLQQGAQQLMQQLQQALNQRDLQSLANCFAEQAILVNILGQRLHGREQISRYLASTFSQWQEEWLSYRLAHMTSLTDSMAIINVQQHRHLRHNNSPSGISAAPLWVIALQAGGWQIMACNAL
jgi:uncharacterized protein (TIGR02246 family)